MHELITLPVPARWRSPPRCFIETHGHGIAELAVLVRRICKVVCKVAILNKKKPEQQFGF
jgi:hypothetical protein